MWKFHLNWSLPAEFIVDNDFVRFTLTLVSGPMLFLMFFWAIRNFTASATNLRSFRTTQCAQFVDEPVGRRFRSIIHNFVIRKYHENCCRERTIRDICSQHETQETSGFFFFDFLVSSPLCVSFAAKIRVSLFLCTYGSSIFSIDRQQRVPLYSISICLHYLLCRSKVGQLFPLFDLCSWLNSTKYSSIYYQFAKCRWWEMVKHYL